MNAAKYLSRFARLSRATLQVVIMVGGIALLIRPEAHPPVGADGFAQVQWHQLVPKAWDPTRRFRSLNLDAMRDNDPRTQRLLSDMRTTWDNAPTVSGLDQARVSLEGFVVPLDGVPGRLREFLLVPYFGACIHTPPPPANQIVHVTIGPNPQQLHVMDFVQVSGTLHTLRQQSLMGASGYELAAARVSVKRESS